MSQPVSPEAWQEFVAAVRERSFEGTITHLVPFGALVTVGPGIPGLLPAPAMTVDPEVGATVAVRVVEIDEQKRRVSLAAA
jgi:ribosomal protein S1